MTVEDPTNQTITLKQTIAPQFEEKTLIPPPPAPQTPQRIQGQQEGWAHLADRMSKEEQQWYAHDATPEQRRDWLKENDTYIKFGEWDIPPVQPR